MVNLSSPVLIIENKNSGKKAKAKLTIHKKPQAKMGGTGRAFFFSGTSVPISPKNTNPYFNHTKKGKEPGY